MKRLFPGCVLLLSHFSFMSPGPAAPLPSMEPEDIKGTIAEAKWVPEKKLKGIPGMSGTAGHDRVTPAHYVITLEDYSGPKKAVARMMNDFVFAAAENPEKESRAPDRLVIWINAEKEMDLAPGMKILVKGYNIRGDEGGTWTSCDSMEIVPSRFKR